MAKNDKTKQDEFTSKIEGAIDDLFKPARKIEIDPSTNEVREGGASAETSLLLEVEESATVAPSPEPQAAPADPGVESVLKELENAFLAIDWEVSQKTVGDYQNALERFTPYQQHDTSGQTAKISVLMGQVLEAMSDSPQDVPASATKALGKGTTALRLIVQKGLDAEAGNAADDACQALETALAVPAKPKDKKTATVSRPAKEEKFTLLSDDDFKEEEADSLDDDLIPDIQEDVIPQELANKLNLHLTVISQCVNRILPLEESFASDERYAKLLATHRELRELLEEEKELISTALKADYSFAKMAPGTSIPEGLFNAVKNHLAAIRQCVKRIKAIEAGFAEKKGYQKFARVEKDLREQLEAQRDSLTKLLTGGAKDAPVQGAKAAIQEELYQTIKQHVTVLEGCVKQILPIENLFAKNKGKGFEPLLKIHQKVRSELENEQRLLVNALAGNFTIIPSQQTGSSPATATAVQVEQPVMKTCPWSSLLTARWNDEFVAFLPEQILFQHKASATLKQAMALANSHLPLATLKPWPWSGPDKALVQALADKGITDLGELAFPILNHPSPFKNAPSADSTPTLLILFHNGKLGAVLVDNPPEPFTFSDLCLWQPVQISGNQLLAGYITTQLDRIPVLSLAGLRFYSFADL